MQHDRRESSTVIDGMARESLKFWTMHLYLRVNYCFMCPGKLSEASAIAIAAAIAMKEVMALREGEEVLIATNPAEDTFQVAWAYYEAAKS